MKQQEQEQQQEQQQEQDFKDVEARAAWACIRMVLMPSGNF